MKFRKKPSEIEAVQYLGFEENGEECERFLGDAFESHIPDWDKIVIRLQGGGELVVNKGNWIVRDPHRGYLLYKPDVFEKMYERVFEQDFDPYSPT